MNKIYQHNNNNNNHGHHHNQQPQQQQQQQQPQQHHQQQQHQHHHQHQQLQQPLQVNRAQQMSHNHPQIYNNDHHSQRHTLSGQQNSVTQNNQVVNRHNRTGTATQNRAAGTNSPFHQQRFQGGSASHLHHQLIPPTGSLHPNQHVGTNMMRHEGDLPLRILVQSDMVGAIIGRSGSTIRQITQQSKARIDVHREENLDQQEKVITISGAPESCSSACFRILEIIQNERAQISNDGSSNSLDNSASANQDSSDSSPEVTLKILAHNNLIGRLIGKNGVSIRKMMEQTSTKINVSMNGLTDCTHERTITVLGNIEQVHQAEQVISSKLRAAYQSDANSTLQAMNQQSYLFNGVPIPYMSGPYAPNPILSTLVDSQAGHAGHALSRTMPVGPHQSQIAGSQIYPGSSNYLSLYPNISGPHGHGLLNFNPSRSSLEERETVNIYIPHSMVGAIIGKSGSAIKEMISTSGASIKVAAAAPQTEVVPLDQAQKEENSSSDQQQQQPRQKAEPEPNEDGCKQDDSKAEPTSEDSNETSGSSVQQQPVSRQSSSENNPSSRKVTIIGTPESQWSAQYLIYRKVAIEDGKSDISLMVEIQVPSQLVGKIIGKGGANVKNIQKQTRTIIRLPDDKSNPTIAESDSLTCVQITGEFQCTQLAQRHIRNIIKESLHRQLVDSRQKSQQTGGAGKQNGKSNAQSNLNDNQHHHSDNENMSNTNDAHDESISSNDRNGSTQDSVHLTDEHSAETSHPKEQSVETSGQQDDESRTSPQIKSARNVVVTGYDESSVLNMNNNTISKDMNASEEVTNKKQPVNTKKVDDTSDNNPNRNHEDTNVESGEKVIKANNLCA